MLEHRTPGLSRDITVQRIDHDRTYAMRATGTLTRDEAHHGELPDCWLRVSIKPGTTEQDNRTPWLEATVTVPEGVTDASCEMFRPLVWSDDGYMDVNLGWHRTDLFR